MDETALEMKAAFEERNRGVDVDAVLGGRGQQLHSFVRANATNADFEILLTVRRSRGARPEVRRFIDFACTLSEWERDHLVGLLTGVSMELLALSEARAAEKITKEFGVTMARHNRRAADQGGPA